MNWPSTAVPGMCKRKDCQALLVCLILVSVVPLISGRPEEEASGAALANDDDGGSSRGVLLGHQKVHWLRPGEEKAPFDEHIPKERWTRLHSKKKQGNAKHSKTNGKHKKKIRNRNKSHKTNGEESATISSGLNYVTSEKKYFDYFPVEQETQDKYHPLHDDDVKVVLLQLDPDRKKLITSENSVHNDKEPPNSSKKRSKREISPSSAIAEVRPEKGINNNEHVRRLRAAEQGNELSTVGQINNPARITRGIDYHRFSQPLNNFYLPAANPIYQGGFHKYAIPGKYFNPLSPPGTYSIGRPSSLEIGSRFGAEEDHVVWDIRYVSNKLPPQAASGGSGSRPTSPPLFHNAATQPPTGQTAGSSSSRTTTTTPRPRSTTRARPQPRPTVRSEPSSCVWAILACCLPNDLNVRINCFEQRGCYGNFWDFNPCADSFQEAALVETEQSINS